MTTFPSAPPPNMCGTRRKASACSESQPSSSDAKTLLTDFFFQIPKILRARFRCMTSFTSRGHIFYLGFLLWHLWMTRPLRARVNTYSHVAPMSPCAKQKVLSLTKPKGKIYKTKPLGHYITDWQGWISTVCPKGLNFIEEKLCCVYNGITSVLFLFRFLNNDQILNADLCSQQLQRVHENLRKSPALVKGRKLHFSRIMQVYILQESRRKRNTWFRLVCSNSSLYSPDLAASDSIFIVLYNMLWMTKILKVKEKRLWKNC